MKPHALRRALWLMNGALGVAVLAAGMGVFTPSEQASAQSHDDLIHAFEAQRRQARWQVQSPVAKADLQAVFARWEAPEYTRAHFRFVGPLPPGKRTAAPADDAPTDPTDLLALGEPNILFSVRGRPAILFAFHSGASEAFGKGDWIRELDDRSERFQLLDIREHDRNGDGRPDAFEVIYGVFHDGALVRRAALAFTNEPDAGARPDVIRDHRAAPAPDRAPSRRPEPDRGASIALAQAAPEVIPFGPRRRALAFTRATYAYVRSKQARALIASVKTSVATRDGRPIGLRITGFGKDLNAQMFRVRKGDILVSINGISVSDRAAALALVQKLPAHEWVTVVLNRNGKLLTYRVDPSDPRTRRQARYFD